VSNDSRSPTWVRSIQDLAAALPDLLSDRLELLALELHRAGRGIAQIVALVLGAVILVLTAWLALCSSIALALISWGWSWPLALLALVLVNLALGWAVLARIRRLTATLGLPATRRHLRFGAPAGPVANPLEGRP
jgi:uncharacterized membrane protein YqjE